MRIGLIQSRGIGDIIIALPLAQFLVDAGHEVHWPIDSRFLSSFRAASPNINFLPVIHPSPGKGASGPRSYFIDEPMAQLQAAGCEIIHILYNYFSNVQVERPDLARHLKFDEYKYAVANVAFSEKWRLSLRRDHEREARLFAQVAPFESYAVVHTEGSDAVLPAKALQDVTRGLPIVEIRPLTDNIFDWLGIIERASRLFMIDSCYSNLVEQLGLQTDKYLWLRSPAHFTPVYKNGWKFIGGTTPATAGRGASSSPSA